MREHIEAAARTFIATHSGEELDIDVLATHSGVNRRCLQQYYTSPRAVELALIQQTESLADDQLYDYLFRD